MKGERRFLHGIGDDQYTDYRKMGGFVSTQPPTGKMKEMSKPTTLIEPNREELTG